MQIPLLLVFISVIHICTRSSTFKRSHVLILCLRVFAAFSMVANHRRLCRKHWPIRGVFCRKHWPITGVSVESIGQSEECSVKSNGQSQRLCRKHWPIRGVFCQKHWPIRGVFCRKHWPIRVFCRKHWPITGVSVESIWRILLNDSQTINFPKPLPCETLICCDWSISFKAVFVNAVLLCVQRYRVTAPEAPSRDKERICIFIQTNEKTPKSGRGIC